MIEAPLQAVNARQLEPCLDASVHGPTLGLSFKKSLLYRGTSLTRNFNPPRTTIGP